MSVNKHKSFRKVLEIARGTTEYNGTIVPFTRVLWCLVDSATSRTVKTRHIGITSYLGSAKFSGCSAWSPRKAVSINLKAPFKSKFFDTVNVNYVIEEANGRASRAYIFGSPDRYKGLKGQVRWWSGDHGWIDVNGMVIEVHACNIKGAKTWYPQTACMYLKDGQDVTLDLCDMGTHLTASVTEGGIFDQAKWDSLDQSKLAFKCDDNGKAINGFFS